MDALRIASLDRLTEQRKKKEQMSKYPSQVFDAEFEHSEVDISFPPKTNHTKCEQTSDVDIHSLSSQTNDANFSDNDSDWANGFNGTSKRTIHYASSSHKSSSAAPFRTSAMGVEEEEDDDDAAFPPPSIVVDVDTFAFTNDDSASNQESLASQSMDGE
ncbi:unnamed protein product [Sphagnum balticum]